MNQPRGCRPLPASTRNNAIQRTELTEAEGRDDYRQLSLIGVPAAAIARRTGRTKETVENALKAEASTAGAKALERGCTTFPSP